MLPDGSAVVLSENSEALLGVDVKLESAFLGATWALTFWVITEASALLGGT